MLKTIKQRKPKLNKHVITKKKKKENQGKQED